MLTLIQNGQVYSPDPVGRASVLLVDGKIGRIGNIDHSTVEALGLEVEVIDAERCLVVPGLIDPHEHLLGGSGENGFSTQFPEITLSEIVTAGITSGGRLGAPASLQGTLDPVRTGTCSYWIRKDLEIVEVISRGKRMVSNGELRVTENFLQESERRIELYGQKK